MVPTQIVSKLGPVYCVLVLFACLVGTRALEYSFGNTSQRHAAQSTSLRQYDRGAATATAEQQEASGIVTPSLHAATPPVWPELFKATLFQNRTGTLALTYLYYDWKAGANLNLIANQLGKTVWDVEWNNGTSFIFSRDEPVCKVMHFDVGILTPDWLNGSKHLGQTETDTFVVDVWTKVDFINYYASVDTGLPVRWTFLWTNAEFHVMSFEEGASLPQQLWQAPPYCFTNSTSSSSALDDQPLANGAMYRLRAAQQVQEDAKQQKQQQQQQVLAS